MRFDVNHDMITNQQDLQLGVKDLKRTWFGDANLGGEFNRLNIMSLLQAGQYDDGVLGNSTWSAGDWNADGEFDRADLILTLQDGGYGQGPRAALAAVPEPAAVILAFVGILCLIVARRRVERFVHAEAMCGRGLRQSSWQSFQP